MTILGVMGEAPKLSADEQAAFLEHYLDRVAGRVPVIVGVSNPGLDNLGRLSKLSMDKGAAGVMVAPVQGLKTEAALRGYFDQVAETLSGTPWVYQDYPQLTGVSISVPQFLDMVDAYSDMVMLKHEDCPGLPKLSAIRAAADKRRVSILCGNGGLYLPQEMQRGADGAMTGFAYPEMLVEIVRRHLAGDVDGAEDLFDVYLPMVKHEQTPGFGLAIRKEVLRRRGVLAHATLRRPGPKLGATDLEELTRLMSRLERALSARGEATRAA